MYVLMGVAPMARWVVDWYGNAADAEAERMKCNAMNYPDTTYKVYSITEIAPSQPMGWDLSDVTPLDTIGVFSVAVVV